MIVVVGAGVFGLTAALALRGRGHAVRVLDPGPLPRPQGASTDTSRAVRMDYGDDEHHARLAGRALHGWREWNERSGRPLYDEVGMLFLTRAAWTPTCFEALSFDLLSRLGARVERLDADAIARRYPAFRPGAYVDGYLSQDAGFAHAADTMAWLAEEARAQGVELEVGTPCRGLLEQGGRVVGVRTAAGEVRGDVVLLAAGAWSASLVPELAPRLRPSAQPLVYVRPADDPARWRAPHLPVWSADISTTGWYAFPADGEGLVKIGHHGAGRDADPDGPRDLEAAELARLRAFLERDMPDLARGAIVRGRTCFYTDTPDGDFLIDRHPDRPGLVLASGGSGHGFKFAPVLGELAADAVEGRGNASLARYRWAGREARGVEAARCRD